jgi:hypothetical protein
MRAIQNQQGIALFGGECISPSYRGRRSAPQFSKQTNRRVAIVVGALLIGFATAATAITVRTLRVAPDDFSHSLPANLMVAPGSVGFEAAVY